MVDSPVQLEPGRKRGQFDVLVDGRIVATRKGGLLAKLLKKPWPDLDQVAAAVRAATHEART